MEKVKRKSLEQNRWPSTIINNKVAVDDEDTKKWLQLVKM